MTSSTQRNTKATYPKWCHCLEKHGVEILVADFDAHALEGDRRSVYVVLRFETEEAALRFYNDPAYESVKRIRLDSTSNGNSVLAKQFVPPKDEKAVVSGRIRTQKTQNSREPDAFRRRSEALEIAALPERAAQRRPLAALAPMIDEAALAHDLLELGQPAHARQVDRP